jgi:hypothetical protein
VAADPQILPCALSVHLSCRVLGHGGHICTQVSILQFRLLAQVLEGFFLHHILQSRVCAEEVSKKFQRCTERAVEWLFFCECLPGGSCSPLMAEDPWWAATIAAGFSTRCLHSFKRNRGLLSHLCQWLWPFPKPTAPWQFWRQTLQQGAWCLFGDG